MTILDSGKRSEFGTGAVRDIQEDKGRMDLLPIDALFELARHFEAGCKKYGDRNWERGIPLSRYIDSALRHAFKFLRGDKDENHLHAAIWNLMCLMQTKMWIEQGVLPDSLNDLPKKKEKVNVEEKRGKDFNGCELCCWCHDNLCRAPSDFRCVKKPMQRGQPPINANVDSLG